jgi:hypothetical protein
MSVFITPIMKIMSFERYLLLLLGLIVTDLRAQVPEYSRHISKAYHVNSNFTLDISNKYGTVQLINRNIDSVRIDVDLRIKAKDNQKLEKLKQAIEFDFTTGQYYIIAHTKFGSSGSDALQDLIDIAGSYFSANNAVSIDYTITAPSNITVKIENKFGNVYLDNHEGNLNLSLSYGDIKANRLNGQSLIKLVSGDGEVNYIKNGELNVSYGNFHLREAVDLRTITRSSNVTIDRVYNLNLDSRRDKIFLFNVLSLSGKSYFSAINITLLTGELSLEGRYGSLFADKISRSFSVIHVTSELTDLTLNFEKPMLFNFELNHSQDVTFFFPKAFASLTTKVVNTQERLSLTSGKFGTGSPVSNVYINALRKCNISISQK